MSCAICHIFGSKLFFIITRPYLPASLFAFVTVCLQQLCPNMQFTFALGCVTLSETNSLQGGIKVLFKLNVYPCKWFGHHMTCCIAFWYCFQKMGTAGIYKLSCSCQQIWIGEKTADAYSIIHTPSQSHITIKHSQKHVYTYRTQIHTLTTCYGLTFLHRSCTFSVFYKNGDPGIKNQKYYLCLLVLVKWNKIKYFITFFFKYSTFLFRG